MSAAADQGLLTPWMPDALQAKSARRIKIVTPSGQSEMLLIHAPCTVTDFAPRQFQPRKIAMISITIPLLSNFFATASMLVGIPSVAFLAFYVFYQAAAITAGAASATNFGSHPDGVLLILKWMTTAIGAIGSVVSAAFEFVFNVLAVVSVAGLLLAILCWFTGHGLSAHAAWARVSAGAILVPLMLASLVIALSVGNLSRLLMLAIAGLCFLALRTLWIGYVTPSV
jgi:hypothetical protein